MKKGAEEVLALAEERSKELPRMFLEEVSRIVKTGGFDLENDSRSLLFGVALENLADNFLRGDRKSKTYRNLIRF